MSSPSVPEHVGLWRPSWCVWWSSGRIIRDTDGCMQWRKHLKRKGKLPVLGADPKARRLPAVWEETVVHFNPRKHRQLLELKERKGRSQQQGQVGNWSSGLVCRTQVVFPNFQSFLLVFFFCGLKKHPTFLQWLQISSSFWENTGKRRGSCQCHCHGQRSFLVPLHTH